MYSPAIQPRVRILPIIISPPKPVYQRIYTPVNLTCQAIGHPIPQIRWFKDNSQLSGMVLPYLYIPELEVRDRGYYHCEAVAVYEDGSNDTVKSDRVVVNIQGMNSARWYDHVIIILSYPGVLQYVIDISVKVSQLQQATGVASPNEQINELFIQVELRMKLYTHIKKI